MTNPKFKHDCSSCKYLGAFRDRDLYFCGTNVGTVDNKHATVIARYGNEACEYSSGLIFDYKFDTVRREAVRRAINIGLLTKEAYKESTGKEWVT